MNTITYKIVKSIIGAVISSVVVAAATPAIANVFKLDVKESKKASSVIPSVDIDEDDTVEEESFMEA